MTAALPAPVVLCRQLTLERAGAPVWSGLDLAVGRGELLAVLGPNGAGKSSLLEVLMGQHRAGGSVQVLGGAPRRGNRRVGYLPQRTERRDVPLRVRDVVQLGLDGHRPGWRRAPGTAAAVDGALTATRVAHLADRPVGRLSGGEQQRVRLAQVLVGRPELLLVDEPFTALDPASRREVAAVLAAAAREQGCAVVVVTHDLEPVRRHLDAVTYLAAGRGRTGTPEQVLTSETLSALHGCPVEVAEVAGRLVLVGDGLVA